MVAVAGRAPDNQVNIVVVAPQNKYRERRHLAAH